MRNILKQSSYLFFAQIATRTVSFFYIIFLARTLGVEEFGLYTAALAYFSIISSLGDLGFNRYLIREAAKDKSLAEELLSNILILRLTFTAVLFAAFAVMIYILDPDSTKVALSLLAVLAIIPQSAALTFDGIFTGFAKLQISGKGLFLHALAIVVVGVYLISKGWGAFGAVTALLIGQFIFALYLFFSLREVKISLSFVKTAVFKKVLAGSLPYGLLGVLGLLYFKIDALLISYLRGSVETGLYGVAYKFLESVVFVPGAFAAALFPALAKLHGKDKGEMKKLYFKSLKLMLIPGAVISVAYFFILPGVIKLLLPDYLPAVPAIQILSLAIPFIFLATPGVAVLFSSGKYLKSVIFFSILTVFFNVVLNLLFIPDFGYIAAAWITVLSDILSFVIFYLLIAKKIFNE